MTAKKKQTTNTEQQIKDETSIPKRIREILARWPINELRPIRLSKAVDDLVTAAREEGINDKTIKQWIIDRSSNGYWHQSQIDAVLADYGLGSYGGGGGGGSSDRDSRGFVGIRDITNLIQKMTGLDELELEKANTKDKLESKSKTHMLDHRSRLSEFELNNMIGEIERLKEIIGILLDSLREQKRAIRNSAITQ